MHELKEFRTFLEKYKAFRNLDDQYKSDKFIALYSRIYEYMLSIPKEKIVISHLIRKQKSIVEYINYMFSYIRCFLEAKDFYHWKNRIYSLLTEKINNVSKRKFELLYRSKAKEFFDIHINSMLNNYKHSNLEKYGYENPSQNLIIQEKIKNTWKNKSKEELDERKRKSEITNLAKYGRKYVGGWLDNSGTSGNSHSKIADDMCLALDTLYGTLNSENTKYFTKNGEFSLSTKDGHKFYYDYTNIIEKWIVEFQGLYSHGLLEGQEYVYNIPVEKIYKRDEEKRILAEQNGYKIFYIYEDEYKSNKSKCLENLIKEIESYVDSKDILK